MTDISSLPRALPFLRARKAGLLKFMLAAGKAFGPRETTDAMTGQGSDHILRDIGAVRTHERRHPSTLGRFL